jgi:arginyl-tRNA synthetase
VRSSADSTLDIDLDLLRKRTNDNPVFYVQYAHTRFTSIARHADDWGITVPADTTQIQVGLLTHPREGDLIRTIGEFGRIVRTAAELREPHRVARYLEELASACHKFYDTDECRVLPYVGAEPTPLLAARRALVSAALQTLANGLRLLGVSAPERM